MIIKWQINQYLSFLKELKDIALRMNITAAKVLAGIVRTTLGPKGMDKMLTSSLGDVTVTNDGATIMREMEINQPAARMLVETAKKQEDIVGDGTTSVVVIAVKLKSYWMTESQHQSL